MTGSKDRSLFYVQAKTHILDLFRYTLFSAIFVYMKLNAVGVASTDIDKTISFYELLGFSFGEPTPDKKHVESISEGTSIRLMIDSQEVIKEIIGEAPKPSNHSGFAIQYSSPGEVDTVVAKIKAAGFAVVKEPWDAFWGQRYAVVADPDNYKVDLYAQIGEK